MNIHRKLIALFLLGWLGVFGVTITVTAQENGKTPAEEASSNTNFIGLLKQGGSAAGGHFRYQ